MMRDIEQDTNRDHLKHTFYIVLIPKLHFKKNMFSAMHFIYYINSSISTKIDLTYLGYCPTAHSVYVLWQEVGANP